jgi:hypothetical protein
MTTPSTPLIQFSDLKFLGMQISYSNHTPAPLSTPLVFGWAIDPLANTPGIQVSMTTPHLLNTNLESVQLLEQQTGSRYSLLAAGYISFHPGYCSALGIAEDATELSEEFAGELGSFLTAQLIRAMEIKTPGAAVDMKNKIEWQFGFAAIEFTLDIVCTGEDWTKAEHLAQVQVTAGQAISEFWDKQDKAAALIAAGKETSEVLSRFGIPPKTH